MTLPDSPELKEKALTQSFSIFIFVSSYFGFSLQFLLFAWYTSSCFFSSLFCFSYPLSKNISPQFRPLHYTEWNISEKNSDRSRAFEPPDGVAEILLVTRYVTMTTWKWWKSESIMALLWNWTLTQKWLYRECRNYKEYQEWWTGRYVNDMLMTSSLNG